MPRIFDNIDSLLLPALQDTLKSFNRADFCVGYFNLRGWKLLDSYINSWSGGPEHCCRLLVGMQKLPQEEIRSAYRIRKNDEQIDNQTAIRLKRQMAIEFRNQLMEGLPTNDDEEGLRKLAQQIKQKKVVVKLYLRHTLHAKLYLLFRSDLTNPSIGYLGSSNLTVSGLRWQGELNIDVPDQDACNKLEKWFEDRWNDHWCLDISEDLVQIIEESWARETPIPPYHIYLKMAFHLSQEARAGLSEYKIPHDLGTTLFDFQTAAVKIAAHHLNKRNGVLIGDVVGLGKTVMATALARVFEDDFGLETLIICPKNLVKMWEDYRQQFRLHAKVLSISQVERELPELRRYRIVLIDESHNLRNREGKRYRAIQEYIRGNDSKCILLSATPYNKTYVDLSNQIRLFVPEDKDLGVRPEKLISEIGELEFIRRHQCSLRSLAAFEKSEYTDDWRELMRLYMVRRTRSFIQQNYADTDKETGRKYLTFADGTRSYFPNRIPKTLKFPINDHDPKDQYGQLYAPEVVDLINHLNLPRYGLGNYLTDPRPVQPTPAEILIFQNLSRAGCRLLGFCRTNLFKRLESSGKAFLQSVDRHIIRNYIYLHALENNQDLPIGTQDIASLDSGLYDEDPDEVHVTSHLFDESDDDPIAVDSTIQTTSTAMKKRAADIYAKYSGEYRNRFKWIRPEFFDKQLQHDLQEDTDAMLSILKKCKEWDADKDYKFIELLNLVSKKHPDKKILIFTQFADTVRYLEAQLIAHKVGKIAGVTGDHDDPSSISWRFSPVSNNKRQNIEPDKEFRVLVATDVLSEGQNLQDCSIIVNYDLPWAIIRLIQRAGRIDRIGQQAQDIMCYSFLPAAGVDRIIDLRGRVRTRLQENAEVLGTDEAFFEDEQETQVLLDLYNEKAGVLDGEAESDVDLSSFAYQIWKNATEENPKLRKEIEDMPNVVYSTRSINCKKMMPVEHCGGALVYVKTAEGNDALAWIDDKGKVITASQFAILKAAECSPNTKALSRKDSHHEIVSKGVRHIIEEEKNVGGQLGRPSGARFRTYQRLKQHAEAIKGTLFESKELLRAIDEIYRCPLRQSAIDTLNRQLRSGVSDETLAEIVISLRNEERFCIVHEEEVVEEPRVVCSMGLIESKV